MTRSGAPDGPTDEVRAEPSDGSAVVPLVSSAATARSPTTTGAVLAPMTPCGGAPDEGLTDDPMDTSPPDGHRPPDADDSPPETQPGQDGIIMTDSVARDAGDANGTTGDASDTIMRPAGAAGIDRSSGALARAADPVQRAKAAAAAAQAEAILSSTGDDGLSQYERERVAKIARNKAFIQSLGLAGAPPPKRRRIRKKKEPEAPTRKSKRESSTYTPGQYSGKPAPSTATTGVETSTVTPAASVQGLSEEEDSSMASEPAAPLQAPERLMEEDLDDVPEEAVDKEAVEEEIEDASAAEDAGPPSEESARVEPSSSTSRGPSTATATTSGTEPDAGAAARGTAPGRARFREPKVPRDVRAAQKAAQRAKLFDSVNGTLVKELTSVVDDSAATSVEASGADDEVAQPPALGAAPAAATDGVESGALARGDGSARVEGSATSVEASGAAMDVDEVAEPPALGAAPAAAADGVESGALARGDGSARAEGGAELPIVLPTPVLHDHPGCLAGLKLVLTGTHARVGGGSGLKLGKQRVGDMIRSFGGTVVEKWSRDINIVVVGDKPGIHKVSRGRQNPTTVIMTLEHLLDGIAQGDYLKALQRVVVTEFVTSDLLAKSTDAQVDFAKNGDSSQLAPSVSRRLRLSLTELAGTVMAETDSQKRPVAVLRAIRNAAFAALVDCAGGDAIKRQLIRDMLDVISKTKTSEEAKTTRRAICDYIRDILKLDVAKNHGCAMPRGDGSAHTLLVPRYAPEEARHYESIHQWLEDAGLPEALAALFDESEASQMLDAWHSEQGRFVTYKTVVGIAAVLSGRCLGRDGIRKCGQRLDEAEPCVNEELVVADVHPAWDPSKAVRKTRSDGSARTPEPDKMEATQTSSKVAKGLYKALLSTGLMRIVWTTGVGPGVAIFEEFSKNYVDATATFESLVNAMRVLAGTHPLDYPLGRLGARVWIGFSDGDAPVATLLIGSPHPCVLTDSHYYIAMALLLLQHGDVGEMISCEESWASSVFLTGFSGFPKGHAGDAALATSEAGLRRVWYNRCRHAYRRALARAEETGEEVDRDKFVEDLMVERAMAKAVAAAAKAVAAAAKDAAAKDCEPFDAAACRRTCRAELDRELQRVRELDAARAAKTTKKAEAAAEKKRKREEAKAEKRRERDAKKAEADAKKSLTDRQELLKRMERAGWSTTETKRKRSKVGNYTTTIYTAPPHVTGKGIYRDGLLEVARDHYPEFLTEAQKEADAEKKRKRDEKEETKKATEASGAKRRKYAPRTGTDDPRKKSELQDKLRAKGLKRSKAPRGS